MSVSRDDLENDRYGTYAPLFTELGQTAAAHPNQLVFGLLKNGFTTPCYDGIFLTPDHQVDGTAVSNSAGGTDTAWHLLDTTRSLKPLIFQERRRYQLQRMDRVDDEHLFSRNEYRYGVDGRCNVGFGLWQLAYGSKQTLNATNYTSAMSAMLGMNGTVSRWVWCQTCWSFRPP